MCRCVRHNSFFFFKEKTAYEMRISDWSSDVCSSDLMVSLGITLVVGLLLWIKGMPLLLGLFLGLFLGLGLPHFVVGFVIKRRIVKFTAKFPDAIELLVRGLRSGLPI